MGTPYFEFSALTIAEALVKAEKELQIPKEDFHYSIVSEEEDAVLIRVFLEKTSSSSFRKESSLQYKPWAGISDESEEVQLLLSFLKDLFVYFEVESEGFFVRQDSPSDYYINVACDEPGILIGKGGKTLEALHSLCSTYISQKRKEKGTLETRMSFQVDIAGYLEKHFDMIRRQVDKAIYRARKIRDDVLIRGEYTPLERKQIHLYAKAQNGISTESQGEGFLKTVLIRLEDH